jgi:hypothetical protein
MMKPFLIQKILGGTNHSVLFPDLNGLQGCPETMIRTGFDLDKNDDPSVQEDQVDFSNRTTIVSLNQLIALPSEILLCELLPLVP